MSSRTLTMDTLVQSDLWREFEKTAHDKRRRPVALLADVIADFLETQEGTAVLTTLSATYATRSTPKMTRWHW